jgi:hypothetical protein
MSPDPHPDPGPGEHWVWRRLRQFWLIIPLVAILFALMASDLGDFVGFSNLSSNSCGTDLDQSSISARMYLPLARWALRYTPTPSVAIIYIDPASDPPDLIINTCASRAFLARLVTDLNALSAHVIVIDKYYFRQRLRRAGQERGVPEGHGEQQGSHRRRPANRSFIRRLGNVRLSCPYPAA